jgi:hypothetical protein
MVAVIVPTTVELVAEVVTENSALVAPEATVTLVGTTRAESEEVSVATIPPEGAGDVSATVPVVVVPPKRTFGEMLRLLTDWPKTKVGTKNNINRSSR